MMQLHFKQSDFNILSLILFGLLKKNEQPFCGDWFAKTKLCGLPFLTAVTVRHNGEVKVECFHFLKLRVVSQVAAKKC